MHKRTGELELYHSSPSVPALWPWFWGLANAASHGIASKREMEEIKTSGRKFSTRPPPLFTPVCPIILLKLNWLLWRNAAFTGCHNLFVSKLAFEQLFWHPCWDNNSLEFVSPNFGRATSYTRISGLTVQSKFAYRSALSFINRAQAINVLTTPMGVYNFARLPNLRPLSYLIRARPLSRFFWHFLQTCLKTTLDWQSVL